jgi:hypothetical protein
VSDLDAAPAVAMIQAGVPVVAPDGSTVAAAIAVKLAWFNKNVNCEGAAARCLAILAAAIEQRAPADEVMAAAKQRGSESALSVLARAHGWCGGTPWQRAALADAVKVLLGAGTDARSALEEVQAGGPGVMRLTADLWPPRVLACSAATTRLLLQHGARVPARALAELLELPPGAAAALGRRVAEERRACIRCVAEFGGTDRLPWRVLRQAVASHGLSPGTCVDFMRAAAWARRGGLVMLRRRLRQAEDAEAHSA